VTGWERHDIEVDVDEGGPRPIDFIGSALEVDSEASSVLNEVQDAIVALVESLQRSGDQFALRWTHSTARYEAFQELSRLYEDQAAGPKCMFSRNIELQHQVALADLKSCKSALSRSGAARGAYVKCLLTEKQIKEAIEKEQRLGHRAAQKF
jgi:hypothetical protein